MPDKEGAQEKSTTKEVVNKKQKQMMGEEGYDVARDEGRVKPSKDKKDATSYPVSDEVRKTQKKNEGPSALEIVKKKYGKAVMDMEKKKNVSEEGKSLLSTPGLDKLKKIKDFKSNADRVFGRKSPDITKVAESFGGQIVGEPVELDEDFGAVSIPTAAVIAKYGLPLAISAIGAYGTARQMQGKQVLPSIKIPNLGIKDKAKKVFGRIKKVFRPNVEKKADINNPRTIKKKNKNQQSGGGDNRRNQSQQDIGGPSGGRNKSNTIDLTKEIKKRRKQLNQDTYNKTKDKFFNNKNKKFNIDKKKAAEVTAAGGVGTAVGTQLNKGKKGKLPKFRPRLPQTSHNIGRTSNPQ